MNRVAFNIFGFNVYYYSLCILLGVIVAYILITREGKKQGLPKEFISDLIFYTLIIGILGARVYYCVFNLDYYLANPSEILKIYNGGLAIHGGVIAGLIFVYFYTKKKNVSFIKILDIVAPAVIIAQSFGRWGNFFNQEAHGGITTYQNLKNMHPRSARRKCKQQSNYKEDCWHNNERNIILFNDRCNKSTRIKIICPTNAA